LFKMYEEMEAFLLKEDTKTFDGFG